MVKTFACHSEARGIFAPYCKRPLVPVKPTCVFSPVKQSSSYQALERFAMKIASDAFPPDRLPAPSSYIAPTGLFSALLFLSRGLHPGLGYPAPSGLSHFRVSVPDCIMPSLGKPYRVVRTIKSRISNSEQTTYCKP